MRITNKALAKLEGILDIEGSTSDLKLQSLQKEAAVSVLNLAIKSDEARFRAQSDMGIMAILREVQALRAAQPAAYIDDEFSVQALPLLN